MTVFHDKCQKAHWGNLLARVVFYWLTLGTEFQVLADGGNCKAVPIRLLPEMGTLRNPPILQETNQDL